jgi:hypothetical protein
MSSPAEQFFDPDDRADDPNGRPGDPDDRSGIPDGATAGSDAAVPSGSLPGAREQAGRRRQQEPGGVLVWTSPAGKTHRTYPETYLGPPVTQPDRPQPTNSGAPAETG